MKKFTVEITDEEEKVLLADMMDIQEWIQNAIAQKARKLTDRIIIQVSDRNPKKIDKSERIRIVRENKIETARERHEKVLEQENRMLKNLERKNG